jgi:S-adenosylmethionine uptake transporter
MSARAIGGTLAGAALVVAFTGMMAGADGITKFIAGAYDAPQLFALSAAIVCGLTMLSARAGGDVRAAFATTCRQAMAIRAALTVLASLAFFQSFRMLPFADVFLFIALIPLLAAALGGPILREAPRPTAWIAVFAGLGGMLFLLPEGLSGLQIGHAWAALAAVSGCGSMLAARHIARAERVPLAQVFWPNAALMSVMGLALPFVWQPMTAIDLGWVVIYSALLFGARYVSAEALRLLPAHVALPLMNLQFVWMVVIGLVFFGEVPAAGTMLGAMLIVASGLWLVAEEQIARSRTA